MQVLDNRSYSQHVVLAEADLALSQVKEKPAKSFKVPLNIVKVWFCVMWKCNLIYLLIVERFDNQWSCSHLTLQ